MKKFSFFIPFVAVAVAFSSCDEIKEENRYIELPMVEAQRTVLLEDFTGQKCINCPTAHEVIHGIIEQYGEDAVAAVAIHPGGNALVTDHTATNGNNGLGTEEAAKVAAISGINAVSSLPQGNINRTGLVDYPSWAAAVRSALEEPTSLRVETGVDSDQSDNARVTLAVKITPSDNFSGKVHVWITEDNIVGRQRIPDGSLNREYVHNHVFRTSVTPVEGEAVTMQKAIVFEKQFAISLSEEWNSENLKAVVFFTGSDGKVEQAHVSALYSVTEE